MWLARGLNEKLTPDLRPEMTDLRFESHNFWSENPTLKFLRPNKRSEILILGLKGLILALRDLS